MSEETISRITEKVIEEMNDWSRRPLDVIHAPALIDAIVLKARDGQVANRPVYATTGSRSPVNAASSACVPAPAVRARCAGSAFTDLRNRDVRDTFFVVRGGLMGLPRGPVQCLAPGDRADLIIHYADLRLCRCGRVLPCQVGFCSGTWTE
ncbi:MAG TPA: transposase [Sporichthyaceae bacterium]|nr:transposase [Sporichthyaceae bacterium]